MAIGEKAWHTPRLYRMELWDPPSLESWLIAQAAKGRHLHSCGSVFFWFERGEKKAVRYRLDAVSALSVDSAQAEEMGWRYVDSLEEEFAVFVCEDPAAPELHTDPMTQSYTTDKLVKAQRRSVALAVATLLVLILLSWNGFFKDALSVRYLIEHNANLYNLAFLAVYVLMLIATLMRSISILTMCRRLRRGLPAGHIGSYRWRAVGSTAILISLVTLCALLFISGEHKGIRSITADSPSPIAFSLAELEDDPAFTPTHFIGPYGDSDYDNCVVILWSPLAPTQYEITRRGEVPGRTWQGGEDYRPALEMHYYKPLIPVLAAPLFDDLLREEGEGRVRTELTYPGVDEALLLTIPEGTFTMLLIRAEGQVLWVKYWGEANLAAALPKLSTALAEME